MPKRRRTKKSKPKSRRDVKIRAHSRSPRGPNKGKPRVIVGGYKRRKPKDTR